jgi:glycosyltransferase involved in cell wall biosynthesis
METRTIEIGYVLKGYPRTSETFIINEIYLLERAGLHLTIFSLKQLTGQRRHGIVDQIAAPVVYLPETTPTTDDRLPNWLGENLPNFSSAHWRLFRRRPLAYLRTLGAVLAMCFRYRAERWCDWSFIKEFLQAGFIALRVLEEGRIKHLHAHFCHTTTTVTMLASRLCSIPFSFTAHAKDIYREDMNPGDLLEVKMRRARFVVTCTRANEEYLDRYRPMATPLKTIYHGLDLALFDGLEDEDREKNVGAAPLILSVGRLVEKKGFTYLVEACGVLRDRGHRFSCRIVGGRDEHAETIERLIARLGLQEIVKLQPAVMQEELREIYTQATLFALPCQIVGSGDRDGIPNVLVEAMAMRLPVVSTDISGIPELIEPHVSGLLVPQKDATALVAAIEELLFDEELRRRLGQAARERVMEHFDARRNILALKALFDSQLKDVPKGSWAAPGEDYADLVTRKHR